MSGCAIVHITPHGDTYAFVAGNAQVIHHVDGSIKVEGVVSEPTWASVASGMITAAGTAFAIYAVH